jgi:hypothetical protein
MANDIDAVFVKQFEAEVKLAYQQQGSLLQGCVRQKKIAGKDTQFSKIGTMEAGPKARNGHVPVSDIDHDGVECVLEDIYTGRYVDKLDLLKTNVGERRAISQSIGFALGRAVDVKIIDAIKSGSVTVGDYSTGFTQGLIQAAIEKLNNASVPADNDRYAIVGAHQWEELMKLDVFAKSNYVGDKSLPWTLGGEARTWRSINWLSHVGTPVSGTQATCLLWHKSAVGLGTGSEIAVEWSWENTRAAYFGQGNTSKGACLIDGAGVVKICCKNDTTL